MSDDERDHKRPRRSSSPAMAQAAPPLAYSKKSTENLDEKKPASSVPPPHSNGTMPVPPLMAPPLQSLISNGLMMPATTGMMPTMMPLPPNMFPPLALPNTTIPNLMIAADKVNRELFVGNTPPGTSEQLLIQFLNGAMQRTNLSAPGHKPLIHCRVNNKFAFVECATAEDANKALKLNGIPFMGMSLRVSRPSKYAGPHQSSESWQDLTGQPLPDDVTPLSGDDRVNRELFVGNTTPEMTEKNLAEFLGKAMEQVGLTTQPGNAITACRLSGKFAFVELRSVQETTNALNLNNIPYMGAQLRVGRPSKYTGPTTPHDNWEDILAKYMSGELKIPSEDDLLAAAAKNTEKTTTRIVELKNMLSEEDLKSDRDYVEILEDTKKECSQFGTLKNVIIPRSGIDASKIFLEYETAEDATKAIKALKGRTFDGRKVAAEYFDEEKFQQKDFTA